MQAGLIGYPLGHSISPQLHQVLWEAQGLEGTYELYELNPSDFASQVADLVHEQNLNCTIPYKQKVLPYLQSLAPEAAVLQAVNTIKAGRGYNTDAPAFAKSSYNFQGQRVIILGTGAVAQTMAHIVAQQGARSLVLTSREPESKGELKSYLQKLYPQLQLAICHVSDLAKLGLLACDYLLQGTNQGMWPQVSALPLPLKFLKEMQAQGLKGVFEAIYNPLATPLILAARSLGLRAKNGLEMLFYQALYAQEIWQEQEIKLSKQQKTVILQRLSTSLLEQKPLNYLLLGYMAAGKSTLVKYLAENCSGPLSFYDLDHEIEQHAGQEIAQIFQEQGEAYFRHLEQQQIGDLLARPGSKVIALGGGAPLEAANQELFKSYPCHLIELDLPFELAWQRGQQDTEIRPLLSQGAGKAQQLYLRRQQEYESLAQLSLDASKSVAALAKDFLEFTGLEFMLQEA